MYFNLMVVLDKFFFSTNKSITLGIYSNVIYYHSY
jgi:hypothetical protein